MDKVIIDGLLVTPLKNIHHPKGNIYHGMKKSDPGYSGFGEAYFSTIAPGEIKGWKQHTKMIMNLVVPVGEVRFVIRDERPDSGTRGACLDVTLSPGNYQRLTVPPGVWMAFQGIGNGLNMLLNIADREHDPAESVNVDLGTFPFPLREK